MIGARPDPRIAVFGFGLVHGLGLATRLQALRLQPEGLVANLLSFNVGVELGQIVALSLVLGSMLLWRRSNIFGATALAANWAIMTAGFVLTGVQLANYLHPMRGSI